MIRSEMRVNRIDGKDVPEYRWVCDCGLEGEWRHVPSKEAPMWDDDISDEHELARQARLARN